MGRRRRQLTAARRDLLEKAVGWLVDGKPFALGKAINAALAGLAAAELELKAAGLRKPTLLVLTGPRAEDRSKAVDVFETAQEGLDFHAKQIYDRASQVVCVKAWRYHPRKAVALHFMNAVEIDMNREKHRNHPVLGPATRLLADFRDEIDRDSDGWAHWAAPVRAAGKLMTLIENPATATEAGFRKAITPIKAFCTRHKRPMPAVEPGVPNG